MKPGKELDILVALKLMGWERHPDFPHLFRDTKLKEHGAFQVDQHIPNYSTDIDAAWEVVDKVKDNTNVFDLLKEKTPHAICLAALKGMGVKFER